jgi:hypothetical protein
VFHQDFKGKIRLFLLNFYTILKISLLIRTLLKVSLKITLVLEFAPTRDEIKKKN